MNRTRSLAMVLLVASLAGCNQAQQAAPPAPPPAVGVQPARMKGVTPSYAFVGRIKAVNTVQLRARVEGFLEKVLFTEGQQVKTGDLLFQIEKTQYQAAVEQADANLAAAEAQALNAQLQFNRSSDLVKTQAISQATVDQNRATLDSAKSEHSAKQSGPVDRPGESRLHRRRKPDRRAHRPDHLHPGKSRQSRERRSGDDRQRRPDLCGISGEHAPDRRHHRRA